MILYLEERQEKNMWTADNWKDYEVLDCSNGEKLERWGKYTLIYFLCQQTTFFSLFFCFFIPFKQICAHPRGVFFAL